MDWAVFVGMALEPLWGNSCRCTYVHLLSVACSWAVSKSFLFRHRSILIGLHCAWKHFHLNSPEGGLNQIFLDHPLWWNSQPSLCVTNFGHCCCEQPPKIACWDTLFLCLWNLSSQVLITHTMGMHCFLPFILQFSCLLSLNIALFWNWTTSSDDK